jgi:hypothetical protein
MIPLMIVPTVFIFLFPLFLSHVMILMSFFLGQDTRSSSCCLFVHMQHKLVTCYAITGSCRLIDFNLHGPNCYIDMARVGKQLYAAYQDFP